MKLKLLKVAHKHIKTARKLKNLEIDPQKQKLKDF